MKLINENGKIEFCANGQVVIDKELPKYQILKSMEKSNIQLHTNNITMDGDENEDVSRFAISVSPDSAQTTQGDLDLRKKFDDIFEPTLRQYMESPDAQAFNAEFSKYLNFEMHYNGYSTSVPASRIMDVSDTKVSDAKKTSFMGKLKNLYKAVNSAVVNEQAKHNDAKAVLHIGDFFDFIHIQGGKEKEFIDRVSGYFKMLDNAKKMGQTALMDNLCQKLILNIYESILSVNGYNKHILFKDLALLKNPGKRMIDIDYVGHFNRVIPQNVIEKKLEADKMCVFDNYAVMYYDPTGASFDVPQKAKRDPILFGLINHSEKLYYIADWEDELCDLTLEKIAERAQIVKKDL